MKIARRSLKHSLMMLGIIGAATMLYSPYFSSHRPSLINDINQITLITTTSISPQNWESESFIKKSTTQRAPNFLIHLVTQKSNSTNDVINANTSHVTNRTLRHQYVRNVTVLPVTTTTHAPDVTYLHILSYQRSGSSFLGGLFHSNPDVFFIYEPMDMLYSAMYGFSPGWTVPADIFYIADNLREIPEDEINAMSWLLEKIYQCEMSTLPTAILIHSFWDKFYQTKDMPVVKNYIRCMDSKKATLTKGVAFNKCRMNIERLCPRRYDYKDKNFDFCKTLLWNNGTWRSSEEEITKIVPPYTALKVRNYFKCLDAYETRARDCAQVELDDVCLSRHFRVVKTVRSTFKVSKVILERLPQSKVIHLMRDPRGAARSRDQAKWSLGLHEKDTASDRAGKYCIRAADDNLKRLEYETTHENRTMRLIYEEMINNLTESSLNVHKFIGLPVSNQTVSFLREKMKNVTMSELVKIPRSSKYKKEKYKIKFEDRAEKWRSYFSQGEVRDMMAACTDFYNGVDFLWVK